MQYYIIDCLSKERHKYLEIHLFTLLIILHNRVSLFYYVRNDLTLTRIIIGSKEGCIGFRVSVFSLSGYQLVCSRRAY